MSAAACSSVVEGSDNRQVETLTLAQPSIAGSPEGVSCGWPDDEDCRPGLVCGRDWVCVAREPPPVIGCTMSSECPPNDVCADKACIPRW